VRGSFTSFTSLRLLGLGFWQAWWMLCLCTPTVLPFAYSAVFPINPVLIVLCLSALGYLALVVMSRWFSPFLSKPYFLVAAAVFSCLGTFVMGALAAGWLGEALVAPYIIATVVTSLGNACLLIMWGELWSTLATGRVGRFLYVSYAFAFVLFFSINALPGLVRVVTVALLPAISTFILHNAQREPRREPAAIMFDMEPVSIPQLLVYLLMMSLAYGFSQSMLNVVSPTPDISSAIFVFAGVGIAALALNIFITQPPIEAFTLYRPILPALSIGLILIVVLPSHLAFVGGGLAVIAAYSLDMLMMLVSTDVSFRGRIPVALTFGLSIFVARMGTLFGTVVSFETFSLSSDPQEFARLILLLCAIVVILVGTLLFPPGDLQKLYRPRTPATTKTEPLKEKCERLGTMCGLTSRELEVLELLASGRSVPYICEELVIAKGTAKHHVSSIYRKLGVFDRQGLHDVMEQGSAGKGAL
jgi:DNA-binding CsgD family transcriptional regulator